MKHKMTFQFERIPSVYSDKGEEDLRDHFFLLEPHFEGNAARETFNKNAKNDILFRYDGGNVLLANVSFGQEQKGFQELD